ncbi:MAG: PAS domain S-box protein [Acidobacteria bacterium]|nr:PAS domain S-box protein [Acidobacteriota bacterium]
MDLRSRLQALIAARVIVGTLLLGSAFLVQLSRPGAFPFDPFFVLIAIVYALSLVYRATLHLIDRHTWLVDLQLCTDALLVAGFIGLTGGIVSYFSSLFVMPIIAASMIRFRRGAVQVATLSALLYMALAVSQYLRAFPYWLGEFDLPTGRFAQYTIGINVCGFIAVALLSGSLANRLRSADARLAHTSLQLDDLRALNEYVIDGLLSGLVTTDTNARILTFNRAAAGITGMSPEQAVGQDARLILQLPEVTRGQLGPLVETGSLRADFEFRSASGRLLDLGLMATMLTFPNGRSGYLFTFQDVTELRRLERNARLQQRLVAVGEMAAGIAHEIRNPLASMSGSIQVLRQELSLSEEQGQLMDIVLRESERLNDTIRSFLAYARPQKFVVAPLDLAKVVRDTVMLIRNSAEARDTHTVDVEAPPEAVWLDADENQIRQVVWNIASNGLRAMSSGGRLVLSVGREVVDGHEEVVLGVSDTGRGIPADEIDGIFQPFKSSFDRGTGLGLAIVHRIVTDYGGEIQVASTVGVGTTMRVRFPVRAMPMTLEPAVAPMPAEVSL